MERGIDNDKEREKTSWERRKARQRYDGNRNPELRNSACNLHNNDDALRTGERKLPCSLIVTHREEREQWRKKRKWISSCTWWSWMSSLPLSILHCLWGDRSERTRRSDDRDGGGEALGESRHHRPAGVHGVQESAGTFPDERSAAVGEYVANYDWRDDARVWRRTEGVNWI